MHLKNLKYYNWTLSGEKHVELLMELGSGRTVLSPGIWIVTAGLSGTHSRHMKKWKYSMCYAFS